MGVIRFCTFPKGSKESKIFADQLRKRENFLSNLGNTEYIKPIRGPNNISNGSQKAANYFPCKYCYGLFKKKYLHRHEKNVICSKKLITKKEIMLKQMLKIFC